MIDLIWQIGIGLAAILALAFGAYRKGRKDETRKTDIERHERDRETKERMRDALERDEEGRSGGRNWVDRLRDLDGQ